MPDLKVNKVFKLSRVVSVLDKASGFFFILGFISSKMPEGPLPILAPAIKIFSIVCFLMGYSFWYLSSLIQKDAPRKRESWYGFFEFKLQFQMAALLGIIATALCIVVPSFTVPTAWLYAISNVIWSIGEYHKKNMPPAHDLSFSTKAQSIFCKYTVGMTFISICSAITATALIIAPLASPVLIPISSVLCGIALVYSMFMNGKYLFTKFPPDQQTVIKVESKKESLPNSPANGLQKELSAASIHEKAPQHFSSPLSTPILQQESTTPTPSLLSTSKSS